VTRKNERSYHQSTPFELQKPHIRRLTPFFGHFWPIGHPTAQEEKHVYIVNNLLTNTYLSC
jgi:hypothetical protein